MSKLVVSAKKQPRRASPWSRWACLVLAATLGMTACGRRPKAGGVVPAASAEAVMVGHPSSATLELGTAVAASEAPPNRPGMVWVPPGVLLAGTPRDRTPRISEEELPGTEIPLAGFFIDKLPYPNEAGAIPSVGLDRHEAARVCESKGKRLCTELEWERACKGPEQATYEYGDVYRSSTCGTGVPVELSARRPSGERVACKSGFGVLEMHGGAWEWTDSAWDRAGTGVARPAPGLPPAPIYVLRGGNAKAGELAGRCANAIGRAETMKSPSMGFRCCAGSRNTAEVHLPAELGPALERFAFSSAEVFEQAASNVWPFWDERESAPARWRAWTWRPAPNEDLVVATGCMTPRGHGGRKVYGHDRCGVLVGRLTGAELQVLKQYEAGFDLSQVMYFEDKGAASRRGLRSRGFDTRGLFLREIRYAYGSVTVSPVRR